MIKDIIDLYSDDYKIVLIDFLESGKSDSVNLIDTSYLEKLVRKGESNG